MPGPMNQTCDHCHYYDQPTQTCHKTSPVTQVIANKAQTVWPPVAPNDWCGDFEPYPR